LWLIGDAKIAKAGEIANEEEEKKRRAAGSARGLVLVVVEARDLDRRLVVKKTKPS